MRSKIIFGLIFVSLSFSNFSQTTKGGSTKNYDEYHVIRDTVYEKVKIPIEKFEFAYISAGPAFSGGTNGSLPNSFWNEWEDNGNWGYPFETGQIGLKTGFNLAWGKFTGIDAINKNLIPDIDIGFEYNFITSVQSFDWSPLAEDIPSSFNDAQEDVFEQMARSSNGSFFTLGFGLGLGVAYHTPIEGMHVRLSYLLTPSYSIPYSFSSPNGSETGAGFEEEVNVEMAYFGGFNAFANYHQLKLNLMYSIGYIGLTFNTQITPISKSITTDHQYVFRDNNTFNSSSTSWQRDYYTSFKLSNLTLDLGFNF